MIDSGSTKPTTSKSGAKPENKDNPVSDGSAKKAEELSAEEQMARYEESLKDDDWGHQPC